MINYKEEINKTVRAFIDIQTETHKGWNDEVQKHYYHHYLEPMTPEIVNYSNKVDNILDIFAQSKQQIDSLVGDNPPFNVDIQNIRIRTR